MDASFLKTTLWLTGRPCSGKTTLSLLLRDACDDLGIRTVNLDGDVVRRGLCADLSYSPEGRKENLRRISHLCQILNENNNFVIATFVSPTHELRQMVRENIKNYKLCYVNCSLAECERRDVKGMYKKAREGKIKDFTGIGSPFEEPIDADVIVDTERNTAANCIHHILDFLKSPSTDYSYYI